MKFIVLHYFLQIKFSLFQPSNIFFSLDGKIKIGDFGLVTTIAEDLRTPGVVQPGYMSRLPDSHHTHRVGTQLYMSPEQVSYKMY